MVIFEGKRNDNSFVGDSFESKNNNNTTKLKPNIKPMANRILQKKQTKKELEEYL